MARDEAGKVGRGQRMKGLIYSAARFALYPEGNARALKSFKSRVTRKNFVLEISS